jgi:hypothetical protein
VDVVACTHEETIGETGEAEVCADVGEGVEGEAAATTTMLELRDCKDTKSNGSSIMAIRTIASVMIRVAYAALRRGLGAF